MLFRLLTLLLITVLFSGGCSKYLAKLDKVLPDKRKEYQQSQSLPDLEVPPDLTNESIDDSLTVPEVNAEGSASFSTYQERVARQQQASKYAAIGDTDAIVDVAGEQIITVQAPAEQTWEELHSFWQDNGYDLDLDDQELGVMETFWKGDEENLKRDKFKLFVEPSAKAGMTTIYLSHRGEDFDQDEWLERDRDLPMEKSMAVELQAALGAVDAPITTSTNSTAATEEVNAPEPEVELIGAGDGKMYLSIPRDLDTSWAIIGRAIDNADNIAIEESNQGGGSYSIVYRPAEGEKKGLLSKLAFWSDDSEKYELSLTAIGQKTEVVVLDEDGKWDDSKTARNILSQLKSNL